MARFSDALKIRPQSPCCARDSKSVSHSNVKASGSKKDKTQDLK